MSENLTILLVIFCSGIAGASIVCLPPLVHRQWVTSRRIDDDLWRDRAPWAFRLISRTSPECVRLIERHLPLSQQERLRRRLQESGLNYAITPAEFVVARLACTMVVLLFSVLLMVAFKRVEIRFLLLMVVCLPLAFFYPDIWLRDVIVRRKRAIEKDFPFFLDVVVLSMKAGLAFPAAIQQSTSRLPDGPIRQEFFRLIREVRTGSNRSEALQKLAARVRLASVSNFVAVVAQADEGGGSLTKALHEQAKQRRRERFQRAEKLANQAPVKLLFPLCAFLFPVTFIIIGYPLYQQLSGTGFLS